MSRIRTDSPRRAVAARGNALDNVLARIDARAGVLLGGEAFPGGSGTFDVHDPADTSVLASVADGDVRQAIAAVDAAEQATGVWAGTSPRRRSELLHRVFDLMHRDSHELVALIVAENGKSVADARAEVTYAAEFFRWFAEEAVRTDGGFGAAPAGGVRTIVTHRPVGVAVLITPWNFPAAMVTRKIAPALAAGCTVVLKPAAETPLTALAIAKLLEEAGVPGGVVNVVPTTQAGAVVGAWLADSRVRKVSFTGSTAVGRHLLHQAADRVLTSSMELGGNAPFVVHADADLALAAEGAMVAKFRGGGQACTAANRFYVHESVADDFSARLADRIARLRVGPGSDPATEIGPLIDERSVERVRSLVEDALVRGASVAAQADVPTWLNGHFYPPTLLVNVDPEARVVQEEVFAPVAPVVTWSARDELLALVNGTEMGLAAYVYSADLKRALQLAECIEAGMVAINRGLVSDPSAPFGGVKQSGLGREGAREGMAEYQETQYFSVDWN